MKPLDDDQIAALKAAACEPAVGINRYWCALKTPDGDGEVD
jgi:hypothetical protein